MKKLLSTLLIPVISCTAIAQDAFQARAILSFDGGGNTVAWILAATDKAVRYKTSANSTQFEDAGISDFSNIYLMEPPQFSEAMDLYEGGKFKEAKEKFAAYKKISKPIAALKGNFHTLSAFYEMECLRQLEDYEAILEILKNFFKEPLTRDHHLRQLELYVMWNAVKSEAWDQVIAIADERYDENLPAYQLAQVAYCKGLALEKKGKPQEALVEYAVAMTADAGASRFTAQNAALNSLRIYNADKEVQAAMEAWGTEDEVKGSLGYNRLREAQGIAKVFRSFLKADKALGDYVKFLEYKFEE
ncbi:MAG: hypothetical protein AB8D78_06545 [Akkermansiaceae bacterium]